MKIKITNVTFADIERIAFKVQGVIEVTANSDILFTEFYCNVYFSNDYIDRYFKCSVEDIYFTDYLFPYTPEIKDKIRDTLLDNFSMLENNYSYAFSKLNGTSKKLIPARYEKKSDMIIAFINENYSRQLALKDIAAGVNFSPSYFHKIFSEFVGKTPHDFLLEKRLETAKTYLLTTDYSIDEIINRCAFSSHSYFDCAFKNAYGITPSEFRKRKFVLCWR